MSTLSSDKLSKAWEFPLRLILIFTLRSVSWVKMTEAIAFDTLITALVCLLPVEDNPIDLRHHESFYVKDEHNFCDIYTNLDRSLINMQSQVMQSEDNLLKVQYNLLNISSTQRPNNIKLELPTECTGLDYGLYELQSMDGNATFFTVCDNIADHVGWMLILRAPFKESFMSTKDWSLGFGVPYEGFFLGFKEVLALTKSHLYEAMFILVPANSNESCYAYFSEFVISPQYFTLEHRGNCRGSCCDLLNSVKNWWNLKTENKLSIKVYIRNKVNDTE